MQNIKCVVVGDTGVGKTCLLIRYTTNSYPGEYIPTVFDNYALSIMIDGEVMQLGLWDTYDDSDGYNRLRYLSYPQTDIFLICFSVISKRSMENVISKWIREVKHACPHVPYIIIGTKTDLRNDENTLKLMPKTDEIVSFREGNMTAIKHGADDYIEVSALMDTQEDINNVFIEAIHSALMQHKKVFPNFEYSMFSAEENTLLLKHRKRFHNFKIYDMHTFVFNLFCLLIDILITIAYTILLMTNVNNNVWNVFVYYQLWICIVPVICIVEFKYILHLIREDLLYTWNIIYYLSIGIIFIPIAIWIAVFINISYFLHCFVFNKFNLLYKNRFNSTFWMDLFYIVDSKNNDFIKKMFAKYHLQNRAIVGETLNKLNINLIDYVESELQHINPFENVNEQLLNDSNESISSKRLIKYMCCNVYCKLISFNYGSQFGKYPEPECTWCNVCLYYGYLLFVCIEHILIVCFLVALYPLYFVSQIVKTVMVCCLIFYEYYYMFDILLLFFFIVILILWIKYVHKFHSNIWKIGYDETMPVLTNGNCVRTLKAIDTTWKEYQTVTTYCLLLRDIFSDDIVRIILEYVNAL